MRVVNCVDLSSGSRSSGLMGMRKSMDLKRARGKWQLVATAILSYVTSGARRYGGRESLRAGGVDGRLRDEEGRLVAAVERVRVDVEENAVVVDGRAGRLALGEFADGEDVATWEEGRRNTVWSTERRSSGRGSSRPPRCSCFVFAWRMGIVVVGVVGVVVEIVAAETVVVEVVAVDDIVVETKTAETAVEFVATDTAVVDTLAGTATAERAGTAAIAYTDTATEKVSSATRCYPPANTGTSQVAACSSGDEAGTGSAVTASGALGLDSVVPLNT